jgi:hypothetical protein
MKKTLALTTLALLAGAASSYAQGQLTMSDYAGGFSIQIFQQQPGTGGPVSVSYGGATGYETMGNTSSTYNYPPGTQTYKAGSAAGSGYDVQLLIGAGSGLAVSSLTPTGGIITSWYRAPGADTTSQFGGVWNNTENVNFGTSGEAVTVAIAAWNNEGGTINSLAAAIAANDPWGVSSAANLTLGGGSVNPVALPTGITDFSLAVPTPEPSTIALGVIGASTLLFRRRNRK